jgi:hypothetical protein
LHAFEGLTVVAKENSQPHFWHRPIYGEWVFGSIY